MRCRPPSSLRAALAAVALLGLAPAAPANAFTFVETQYLPAVQLAAGQSAAVNVTNIAGGGTLVAVVTIINGLGSTVSAKTETIAAGVTVSIPVKAGGKPLRLFATVALDAPQAAICDIETFDVNSGQVLAIVPVARVVGP